MQQNMLISILVGMSAKFSPSPFLANVRKCMFGLFSLLNKIDGFTISRSVECDGLLPGSRLVCRTLCLLTQRNPDDALPNCRVTSGKIDTPDSVYVGVYGESLHEHTALESTHIKKTVLFYTLPCGEAR